MMYFWLTLASAYILLLGFFAYAAVLQSWDRLKIGIKVLIAPAFFLFYLLDIVLNSTIGSIMFFELPSWQRKTFSERCEYHMNDISYKGAVAGAFCFLLNSIIVGHCKGKS